MSELYRDFIDRKLDQIDGHLIDIYNAIGGGGPTPISFTKTLLCDNSTLNASITLNDDISNYDFIEVIIGANGMKDQGGYYMTENCFKDIEDISGGVICFCIFASSYNCTITRSGNTWTEYDTPTMHIKRVYGYKCNKIITETSIYKATLNTNNTITINDPNLNLFDYDYVLFGFNNATTSRIGPCFNVLTKIIGEPLYYIYNKYNLYSLLQISNTSITNINASYIRGYKIN